MRRPAVVALTTAILICAALPVRAERFHVMPGGLRTSGPSVPDVWTPENCYPTLASGLQAASPADTLLLSLDDHPLATAGALPAMLANRELSGDATACRVLLGAGAGLEVAAAAVHTVVRGISFQPDDPAATLPALRILPPEAPAAAVVVESCRFSFLTGAVWSGAGGAAIHAAGSEHRLAVTLRGNYFGDCSSGGRGGAVYAADGVDLLLEECLFERNESRYTGSAVLGGAVAVLAGVHGSTLLVERCEFVDSVAWGPGGAIYVQDCDLTLRDTEVRNSRSAHGGVTNWSSGAGVFLRRVGDDPEPVQLIAERCRFIGNRGDLSLGTGAGDGGGLMVRGSDNDSPVSVSIVDCLFADNFNDQGAGLYVGRGATGTIERTLFLNNTAHSNGGGAYKGGALSSNIGETALFIYCVFAGNRAGWDQDGQPLTDRGWGGGFQTRRYPRGEFHNCTFADNLSGVSVGRGDAFYNWADGGSFYHSLLRSRLVNCLFYGAEGNDVQVRSDLNGFSEVLNCAWEPGEFVALGQSFEPTVSLDGSPFAPGGWDLAPDSACIDAGADLGYTTDFAGAPVPSGVAPDIGALEYLIPVGVADLPDGADPVRSLFLLPARPNPANPRTEVAFALQRPASVRLTVHDLAGRLIAVLHDGPLPAGEHRTGWDGRRADGGALPSGVYLVRLAAGDAVATQKVMLVR